MNCINMSDEREKIRATLLSHRESDATLIEEYMAECEHQEGSGYWLQFRKLSDLLEDFDLYKEHNDE